MRLLRDSLRTFTEYQAIASNVQADPEDRYRIEEEVRLARENLYAEFVWPVDHLHRAPPAEQEQQNAGNEDTSRVCCVVCLEVKDSVRELKLFKLQQNKIIITTKQDQNANIFFLFLFSLFIGPGSWTVWTCCVRWLFDRSYSERSAQLHWPSPVQVPYLPCCVRRIKANHPSFWLIDSVFSGLIWICLSTILFPGKLLIFFF